MTVLRSGREAIETSKHAGLAILYLLVIPVFFQLSDGDPVTQDPSAHGHTTPKFAPGDGLHSEVIFVCVVASAEEAGAHLRKRKQNKQTKNPTTVSASFYVINGTSLS